MDVCFESQERLSTLIASLAVFKHGKEAALSVSEALNTENRVLHEYAT